MEQMRFSHAIWHSAKSMAGESDVKGGVAEGPGWKFTVPATAGRMLTLARNKSSLDQMELRMKDFLASSGYTHDEADANDALTGSVEPEKCRLIYFLTDDVTTSYNKSTVVSKFKGDVEAVSHLFAESYGRHVFKYLDYSEQTT